MSSNKTNVPVIAITADDEPGNESDSEMNIEDTGTDVEDIYVKSDKRKKLRKHTKPKETYLTDVEDMEGSDDEMVTPIIKHKNPIQIDNQIFDQEIPIVEELYNKKGKCNRKKPKLKSQTSLSTNAHFLSPNEMESYQVLTDVENFDGSDYEENTLFDNDASETDLLKEIINDTGSIAISDNVKRFLQSVPSPMVTPSMDYSDNEYNKEVANSKSLRTKKKYSRNHISPISNSPHLSDLTDTETMIYDSNDDMKMKSNKNTCIKKRRNKQSVTNLMDITDYEDVDISDEDLNKLKTIENISDSIEITPEKLKEIFSSSNFLNMKSSQNDTFENNESDDERKFLKKEKLENEQKYSLNVPKYDNEVFTDTEDLDYVPENNSIQTQYIHTIPGYLEANSESTNEKMIIKESKNLNKVAETPVIQKKFFNEENNDTDEEDDILVDSDINYQSGIVEDKVAFHFLDINTKNKKIKTAKVTISNLQVSSNNKEDQLTDVENISSSDNDENDIPATIVNYELPFDTDSESVDGENENFLVSNEFEPYNFIPAVSRKLINETELSDNVSKILCTNLNDESDSLGTEISNIKTDIEEFSTDEFEEEEDIAEKFAMPFNFNDSEKIQQKDSLTIPVIEKTEDPETDIEDTETMTHSKSKRINRFLQVENDNIDNITDTEDLEVNHIEKTENYLIVKSIDNVAKTDTEDFDTSDIDIENPSLEHSRTPDILSQMECATVCSKEGSGCFSTDEKMKLNEKHRSISFPEVELPNNEEKNDVMYLKGGCSFLDDLVTDETFDLLKEKFVNQNSTLMNKIFLNINSSQKETKIEMEVSEENNTKISWLQGNIKEIREEWRPAKDTTSPTQKVTEESARDAAQQETQTGSSSATFSGTAAANVLRDEAITDEKQETTESSQTTPQHRSVADQHQLSCEMKELLEEMEKQSKQ